MVEPVEQALPPSDVGSLAPGASVVHSDFGEGVITSLPVNGFIRVFFSTGERQVALASLRTAIPRAERVLRNVAGSSDRLRRAWLAYEAHAIPIMENTAALTAAKIDLLPHQIVLTQRIATAGPRRFLVADEVGLGKTIEAALLLRELASRGELQRAMMVVPAGLVNNWHRELNEVFSLNFEVFGSEGDVTDRKSNAFLKHDRLIVSIDTLKRPPRVKRLLEAPMWDLVVFDEAHHLTAYRNGRKVTRTQNYKLAESLRGHARDLLLLSATPHQGDHFRFWMLMQLLNPTLFNSAEDMVKHRHRLNAVVFRRTKADACKPDGSPLFARRLVNTESFTMSDGERVFYEELRKYLEDGFALAKRQGAKGQSLGFVMTIFQKIAASSFAAVRRTLQRRLLMLTVHEAIIRDQELDIQGRQRLLDEARRLIHEHYGLADDATSRAEVDRILADIKVRLLRKLDEEQLALAADEYTSEATVAASEELATVSVENALPEERTRIRTVLERFPGLRETKADKLLRALGALWNQDPKEKVVIFATYLGTVDMLEHEIEREYPGQGVVVLRGGDHGAKLAAERRFRRDDGPRVLVCTAAGREGINLQLARILFNFDLPWNPMDLEQRIGRIHRYGQRHTAQVYNLVLSDTIEGSIFLLLNEKLTEIAKAIGKVDEQGNMAEDLRIQILGQLSERLSYDRLYQDALSDPHLRRTRLEIEAALSNADEARKVVFELFQDLDGFNLDEYRPFADTKAGMNRLVRFLTAALKEDGSSLVSLGGNLFEVCDSTGNKSARLITDRDQAKQSDLDLLGVDHPLIQVELKKWRGLPPEELGVAVATDTASGVLSWWYIETRSDLGEIRFNLLPLGVSSNGSRLVPLERLGEAHFHAPSTETVLSLESRKKLLKNIEDMLQRELQHKGLVKDGATFTARLVGWIEAVAR